MVKQTRGIEVPIDHLPLDDEKAYDLLNKANRWACSNWNPAGCGTCAGSSRSIPSRHHGADCAVSAGPMELIPEFIKRRHGEIRIEYEHRCSSRSAADLWIMIYQEQVMQATQVLAGYTLGRRICCGARWARRRSRKWPSSARGSSRAARR